MPKKHPKPEVEKTPYQKRTFIRKFAYTPIFTRQKKPHMQSIFESKWMHMWISEWEHYTPKETSHERCYIYIWLV
jgi:hypothetical protein